VGNQSDQTSGKLIDPDVHQLMNQGDESRIKSMK